jgi:histidine ammonia-lyase
VEQKASAGEVVYGVTTGFGKFADVVISPEQTRTLQQNLIASHAVGVGEGFSKEVVRAMLLLRANALAKGHSGLRLCVVQRLVDFLNLHLHPVVPQQGSLGASGDLAPLAHVALALVGEGQIMGPNGPRPARELLEEHDLPPLVLEAKEGLALINGTQAMTAQGALTLAAAARLTRAAEAAAALSFQALRGIPQAFDERIQAVRPHQGQRRTAQRLRALLEDSRMTTRPGELRVQDAYSLRCLPQVIGAVRQALDHTRQVLEIELNSATDNPLIFEADGAVISAGNFHGQPVAMVLDYLALALAELASIAERRIERLVNPQLSEGLPPFLTRQGGLNSGMMLLQYTAAALVSENKSLAHPASVDSIPSSANQEDHVSMGTISARKTQRIYENTARVIAIELLCAAQAVEFRTSDPGRDLSRPTQGVFEAVRELSPRLERDRPLSEDIERVAGWLQTDEIDKLVGHE